MAIPTVVGTAKNSVSGSGACPVTPPAGAQGYLALIALYANAAGDITVPSGWTAVGSSLTPGWTGWAIYTSNSTPPGSGWAHNDTTGVMSVLVVGYDGPLTIHQQLGANGLTSPTVTTTEGALIVRTVLGNWFAGVPSVTYPTAAPNNRDVQSANNGAGDYHLAAVAHSTQASAGATGTAVWTVSGATSEDPIHAHTIALTTTGGAPPATSHPVRHPAYRLLPILVR